MGKPLNEARILVLLGSVLSGMFPFIALSQSSSPNAKTDVRAPVSSPATANRRVVHRVRPAALSPHAMQRYQVLWGVDSLGVKAVESGQMIRFSYRVLDSNKAAAVNDKKATPFLIDEAAHVKLVVPDMEKVGQLRQSSAPEAGKSYWMVFSNKGGIVKRGDRVSVQIGKFRVDGLVVE
jgi:hypothetical protein